MKKTENILERIAKQGVVLGDGGYLIELERRGWVDSGSGREQVGTGKGSGQFTPEVAIEHPDALRELHREFLHAGSQVLQALTFFGTREKLRRAGYGEQTEAINSAAVRIAREVAGDRALVAGSVSRTQLFEREGPSAASHVRDLIVEQVRLLADAGVDFLILETFFHLQEMLIAIGCSRVSGLPILATMTFRPTLNRCSDGHTPGDCARAMVDAGAAMVGVNCEQEPERMLAITREMRKAVNVPLAAQPAAFRTTDASPCFTRLPQFPDEMESIQLPRNAFQRLGEQARAEGIQYVGGCCGCNAAYIQALARGLNAAASPADINGCARGCASGSFARVTSSRTRNPLRMRSCNPIRGGK
jgi:betaine-homocysteine S-methyltransferase